MTTATMALTELAEKGADIDVLRQMVQFMAQRLKAAGKLPKVVITACMRKLLMVMNVVLKTGQAWRSSTPTQA